MLCGRERETLCSQKQYFWLHVLFTNACFTRCVTQQQPLFTRVGLHSTGNDAAALERFGERVLYETKEERELKARLLAIENQLELFKTPQEMEVVT